jgi:hypothetical protein
MIGGALLSAGGSAGIQKVTTGRVSYREVAVAGVIGAGAGGLGAGAGALVSGASKGAALGRLALAGGVESVSGGMADRGVHGGNAFNPRGLAIDLLTGGAAPSVAGHLGDDAARIADDAVIVRGGTKPMPEPGELFSGSHGHDFAEAARGVPHGQVREASAGDIRASGGSVEHNPEFDERVGRTNYQHVDVRLGEGPDPFSDLKGNPWKKPDRWGGENYPYVDE